MGKATLVLVAIILGYLSPWLASPDDGQFLFLWFNWLPTLAAQWLSTSSAPLALTVDVFVLAAQYLALFAVAARVGPLATIAADFMSGPKHHTGLIR
ncbi:MAG: hypothetical protein V4684_04545 [Pseudomonadota bacterium]